MPHGYNGKILHVNLTTGAITVEEPDEAFYRKYMGGSAMGMHYVLRHTPAKVDALHPANTLALMGSVTVGAAISGQSRMTATAKSPLTDAIGDSQCGGFFPAELKFAGFDGIVIHGRAASPVYLWIKNGAAELRDASHLWGKITGEAESLIRAELGDEKIEVIQVGPAGENAVRFAAIISMSNRAHGRTGMGAVMGSKNLKAIAVRGTSKPSIADRKTLGELARWGAKNLDTSDVAGTAKYGTSETVGGNQKAGGLPTFNFNSGSFDGWEQIDGELLYDQYLRGADEGKQDSRGRDTCYACTVRCKRVMEWEDARYRIDPHYGGPEYETLATFGSYCGISDIVAIGKANQLCNEYGMDTISCGATIAWAYETFSEGALTLADTGGLDLSFGNAESMVRLTEMIGRREGFGAVLAEGSARAADILGRGHAFLIVSKKQETPAHMPQSKISLGLIYAVNPFGSDHQSSEHDPNYNARYAEKLAQIGLHEPMHPRLMNEEKVKFALRTQWSYSALDSVNLCQFVYGPTWQLYHMQQMADTVNAVTGWDVTVDELQELGERRLNMLRAFNAREGLGKEYDTLPDKMFEKALVGGKSDGRKLDRAEWLAHRDVYYRMAGWDAESGNPTAETLARLGLAWVGGQ
jgi:aldehyde:ferredoxin oxidoreductase